MFELIGKTALVTGGGQHVGEGIAKALASVGARVIVNDLDADRAARVAGAVGGDAAPFDVTDAAAVSAAIADLGPIDILVNNAGIPAAGMQVVEFRDMDPAMWRRFVDLNFYGGLHCIHAVVDGMCERGWGRIVQISSAAGRIGVPRGISLYGASKSGIEGFIRHLSQELARTGVTANTIALGMMDHVPPEAVERLARATPMGRLGTPDDVGAAVVYVASVEAAWLTGQTIQLSGGQVTT